MRSKEQIAVLHDLFNQINERLEIIGETPDAYFLCQCAEILKQQGVTIDAQDTSITELEAQLADAKKDAARWQAVKPMFRTMSANIDGNHTWTLAYHGSLKGASIDDAADKVIQADGKA
jgi:hypothetical protein